MKIKDQTNLLSSKRLTIPELNKDFARWFLFLSKLKTNPTFTYFDGTEITVTNPIEVIRSIVSGDGRLDMDKVKEFFKPKNRYIPVIKTNKGNIKLNDFHKSVEFGGGCGTSLGSINAATYETIQALFFSLRQYLERDIEINDVSILYDEVSKNDDSLGILKDVKSKRIITKNDLKFFENRGWLYTYIITANKFFDSLNTHKHYTFYHQYAGHGIADEVYNAFTKIFKPINKENNIRISMSRWNPSDIWAVETDFEEEIIDSLKNTKNLIELNAIMDSCFYNNYFVGISLKKIPKDKNIALIVNKTLEPNFIYDHTSLSEGYFDTLTVQIKSKSFSWLGQKRDEIIDTRIYTGKQISNIFLEVKGSESKYGKTSMTYINSLLNKLNINQIPHYKDIKLSNDELKKEIIRLYNNIPNLEKTKSISNKFNIEEIRSKLISKYQSLLLIDILEKNKRKPHKKTLFGLIAFIFNRKLNLTNYIIKEIFYYCYSMGGELFDNSKFYRIRTL